MVQPLNLEDTVTALKILELQLAAFQVEARLAGYAEPPLLNDGLPSLRQSGEAFWGIVEDDRLLGAVSTGIREETVEIRRLMVHPEHFRKKIASRLLEHVLNTNSPFQSFIVNVNEHNIPAIALYRKYGFRETGRQELAPGVTLLHLKRP